jgi:hypothetical protein
VRPAQTILSVPLVFLPLVYLGGCRILGPGYIGPVHPPPLDTPIAVNDLRAIEYGDEIIAGFTIPNVTTEGLELRSLRSVDLYAGPGEGANDPNSWYRTATHYAVPASAPGALERRIPVQAWIGKDVVLRVRSTGPKGKISLWSLPFVLGVIAPLQRPTDLKWESRKDGVHLTWRGAGPEFRVLRAGPDGMYQPLKDTDKPEYIDDTAQFGMRYQYMVQALANEKDDKQQSLVSDPVSTTTLIDTFPPEVPAGVAAAAGVNTIDLEWERNTETDFKGYNIFRSVDGGPFEKIASLIEAPTYSDMNVQPGKSYRYQISSVDLTGNESARSEPVSAALP